MGSFSIWHWLVVLVIIVLIFGTKKLKNIGQDLGDAVKNFKKAVTDDNPDSKSNQSSNDKANNNKSKAKPNESE